MARQAARFSHGWWATRKRHFIFAGALQTEGFLVPAIRYPTVAKGAARLRITVTAAHEEDHVRSLCKAIGKLMKPE